MANKTRPHQVHFRLSTAETWELWEKVEISGKTQQEYLRCCALGKKITNTNGIRAIVPELKRIGNNLNQIARNCNAGSPAAAAEVEQIRKELEEVWQRLRQFLRGVE